MRAIPRPGTVVSLPERAYSPPASAARGHVPVTGTPLRILHVVRQYAPGIGGLETYVAMLAQVQRAQGHSVGVLTLDRIYDGDGAALPAAETIDGIAVQRVPFSGSKRYPLAPAALGRVKEADIVHVHAVDSFLDMLSWTSVLHRKPLVLSTHGGFFHTGYAQRLKRLFFNTATRAALLNVRAILASSVQDYRLFAPLARRKTMLVENGVDFERFLGLARPGSRRIIYFGRIAPNKGIERLLAWFAALHARDPRWALTIAGKPMGVDPAALRAEAARLGIADALDIHIAPSDAVLHALIARCSVFAGPSHYEGFGIAAVEAAAAGLYPVLSDIPAFTRTRERIGFGTIVDFDATPDPDGFLRDLAAFEAAPPTPDALAQALGPFAWSRVAASIDAIYGRVLGHKVRHIGHVDVCVLEREEALSSILDAVRERRTTMIGFCNAHTVNVASRDPGFAAALGRELILNDGVGIDIASRLLYGRRFPSNLNGTDLIPEMLARLPEGTRVFLLGSTQEVATEAGHHLAQRFPNIVVAGIRHGFFAEAEEAGIAETILAARADVVLAGMGQPRQELWASRNVDRLGLPVICVGALLDFQSGLIPRAPKFIQNMGFEWAFRLAMEPRRLARRYLIGNATFLARIAVQWLSSRRSAS